MEQLQSELDSVAADLIEGLITRKLKITVAESCTGGWIAQSLTDVVGSSVCFDGAVVSYADEIKRGLLNVSVETLKVHGAVSAEVVTEMSSGVLRLMNADIAVATSGIAGPGGGSEAKPVGLVFFAVAQKGGKTQAWAEHFSGDRRAVRQQAVLCALRRVTSTLKVMENMG